VQASIADLNEAEEAANAAAEAKTQSKTISKKKATLGPGLLLWNEVRLQRIDGKDKKKAQ